MERARRRRRVPAFGEWNYYYYSGELSTPAAAAAAEWYAPAAEADARSEAWFRYPSPPRKPPPTGRKVARRPDTAEKPYNGGGGKQRRGRQRDATPARSSEAGGAPAAARTPAAKAAAASRARVVRPVDADLYQVPPPEFAVPGERTRRKKGARSMWMACFGFNCVA